MKTIQLIIFLLLVSTTKIFAQQSDTIIIYDPVKVPAINQYVPAENKVLKAEMVQPSVTITFKPTGFNFSDKAFINLKNSFPGTSSLIPPITLPVKKIDGHLSEAENKIIEK